MKVVVTVAPLAGRCANCPEGLSFMAFQFGVPFAEFDLTPGKPEFCRAGELLLASAAVIRGGGGGAYAGAAVR